MPQLLAKGAEACLYLESWYDYQVVRKHRIRKSYRLAQLDQALRSDRTIREARLLSAARQAGVWTPVIFSVIPEEATIIMEFIEGQRLKDVLSVLSATKRRRLFTQIGETVAKLHSSHISHGDLTTSNMILHPQGKICLVDFGLASVTQNPEDLGTDLHLLRRALLSAHYPQWEQCFTAFKKGYEQTYGSDANNVFHRIDVIESRGRYIAERVR